GTKLYNTVAEGGSRVASNIYNSLASAPEKFKAWRENKTAEKNAITADRGELTNSIGALAKEKNPSMLSRAQEGISGLFKKIRSFGEFAETNGFLMTKKERNDYHEVLRKFKEDGLKEKATADHAHPQAGAILKKGELFDTFKRIFAEAGGHGGGDNHYDHHYPLAGGGHH
nr:hypothetical protein [Candidatus Paceibacterota bacterium]